MQFLKPSITAFSIITLITTILTGGALSQSGRGRPRVPQPSPATSQPQPVSVPAATAVIKQEQAGTTSIFVLRNGITVVISEQHANALAAAVAYFKAGVLDDPGLMSAARLVERMIFRGTVLRPGDRGLADLGAIGTSVDASTSLDGASYSLVSSSDKIKDALAIQADMLQNPSFDAEAMRREIPVVIEAEKTAGLFRQRGSAFLSDAFTPRKLNMDASELALARLIDFDEPAAYSMARLLDIAFTGGAPASPDGLRSMTREQLVEFYQSRYRPDNLVISIAGDVSTFDTLVKIQQLYGEFGAKPGEAAQQSSKGASVVKTRAASPSPPERPHPSPSSSDNQRETAKSSGSDKSSTGKRSLTTEQNKLRYSADRADINQSIVSVGFHVPGIESKEWPAMEVLTALAGLGRASRLSRSLIDGQMIANRIESNYLALAGGGLLTVQMWSATDSREGSSIDKAESALFKELDRLRREVPTDAEMSRARMLLEKRFVDETGIYLGRAQAFARAEASAGGFRAVLDYQTRIRAVGAEDLQRAAAKYLTLENTSIHEYEPLSAAARTFSADTFAQTVTAWAPGFAQPVEGAGVRAADANYSPAPVSQVPERSPERRAMIESVQPLPVKDFSTLNGPKAFVREDHSQQKVTVAILFQGGRLIEDSTTSGTTELMLRSILYGTPRRTYSQTTQELEGLGADVQIVVEPDFFGFMLGVLSPGADRALKLLRDAIEEPAFRDDDIGRARLGQLAAIRDARDSSFVRSRELLLQALLPGHPYSFPDHGSEQVVAALTSEKLREWHGRVIKRQLPVAIIVGDTDGSALVSSQLAEGFRRRELEGSIQVKTPQPVTASEKAEQRRREQTTVAVGLSGPKADSADLTALQLIESAMNGPGGRLLRELRDRQNIISAAMLSDEARFSAGAIFAFAATSPENEQRARAGLLVELERVARGGLTEGELASARALAATSLIARLQVQSEHALQYARAVFYRHQASDADTFGERASKVTAEEIKRVASAYFKVSTACASVVRGIPPVTVPSPTKQD